MNNFNVVIDKAQYGICLLDHDGLFSYVNQRFADMNGYAVEELLGKNYSFLHTAEQVKKVDALIKTLRLQGSFSGQEGWFKRKDSTVYPVSLSGTLINDDKDEAVCMSIMGIDITEQKKIETALKASEKIYRLIFDNSPVGIFHFDKEGKILAYNDSFREIVGATKQELAHFNVLQDSHDEGMEVAFIACFSGMVGHFEGAFTVGAGREPKTVKIDFYDYR